MKEHNYAFQNADTLSSSAKLDTKHMFCYLDFGCYFEANGQNHGIFGSYSFLRIALHDIFSLSHHLLASWNLYISRVAESKSKNSSSRQV